MYVSCKQSIAMYRAWCSERWPVQFIVKAIRPADLAHFPEVSALKDLKFVVDVPDDLLCLLPHTEHIGLEKYHFVFS